MHNSMMKDASTLYVLTLHTPRQERKRGLGVWAGPKAVRPPKDCNEAVNQFECVSCGYVADRATLEIDIRGKPRRAEGRGAEGHGAPLQFEAIVANMLDAMRPSGDRLREAKMLLLAQHGWQVGTHYSEVHAHPRMV